ncbi:MAG: Hsp20/alpha crystallin family protein [Planctomycetota bacterium]
MNLRSLVPWRNKNGGTVTHPVPTNPLERMRWEMDQAFDRFLGDLWPSKGPFAEWMEGAWAPSLDVKETDDEIVVRAEIPGVDPKDLEITLSGDTLTLAGKKEEKTEKKEENFHHTECSFGEFRRTLRLPATVDTEKVTAEHNNGVVTIHVKKVPGAVPKKVPVTSN